MQEQGKATGAFPVGATQDGPLNVALDGTPLLGDRTGVGVFCLEALRALAERSELGVSAFAVSWRRRHELHEHLPPRVLDHQRAMPARPLHWSWTRFSTPPAEWFIGRADVVHGTNYVVPPTRHAARVVTVHDLTSVRYPDMCDPASLRFPDLVRRAAEAGAWVHTPSRFVADEVVNELGVDRSRVRAVHHGVPRHFDQIGHLSDASYVDSLLPARGLRFALAVGTIEPRKDYPLLVRAFDRVCDEIGDVALVIAGASGWGSAAFEECLASIRHRDRIVRLGYVDDARRVQLLAKAALVAYPSVYEGFGFVPLEAMAAGVPVVATSAGAIPEVVGDAACLVAQGDLDALADAIHSLLTDDAERTTLIEKGLSRASQFKWSECASGLSALYFDAAADRR